LLSLASWFILKGAEVSVSDGIKRQYGATLSDEERHDVRTARIVMSSRDEFHLPMLTTDNACHQVATVRYRLTDNDMKLKKNALGRSKYWKAHFTFSVNIGAADLRFQILGDNGVLSTDHESLNVAFMDPAEGAAQPPAEPVRFAAPSSRSSHIELASARVRSLLRRR
jgi:hypothetical protein